MYAQNNGKITGTVVDSQTGESLIGVNVVIEGTIKGTATDIGGRYTIRNVEPGTYTIVVSYLSFATQTITNVVVDQGQTLTLDILLQEETEFLDEIVVTADVVKSGEAGLLSIQRKSVPVQDGISFEEISKGSDGNVGAAMKKVAGVSVVGGKDIYVRGLGNRYSNVQLNGSPIPSTNPNKKEAPLDILSAGIIDNIVVQKTYTPDQSGEFSGGSVQIITKEFPNEKKIGFSYSTSVNGHYYMQNYLGYNGGRRDFLGYDDGFRNLPSDIKDGEISDTREATRVVEQLNNSWSSKNITSLPSQKMGFTYANQFDNATIPVGIVSNVSYKYETSSRFDEDLRYIVNYKEDTGEASLGSEYKRNTGIESTNLSTMLNIFAKPNSTTKVGIKNLYSNSSSNKFSEIVGSYFNFDAINSQAVLEFDRRAIFSSSLNAEKYFENFYQSKLDVVVSYSKAVRDLPDRRTTQYAENEIGIYEIVFPNRGNTHFFSFQNDNNYSGKLDYSFGGLNDVKIKTGGVFLIKDRDFKSYKLVYEKRSEFSNSDLSASPENILTAENIRNESVGLYESSSSRDSYRGYQQLFAGYISMNWNLADKWTFEGGLRAENSAQFIDDEVLINELDYLPALNITYRPTEKINLRSAISITLARPEFRELSNFSFQDYIGGRTVYGNPDLKRTRIYNYDLRFELFPETGELLAVSAFYKYFENPIEIFYRITQNNEVKFDNVNSASLFGLELEARRNISERLRLNTNFSYILSQVNYADGQAIGRQANEERTMFGQSPFTVNVNAFYTFPEIKSDLTISFNTFGKRISTVGNNEQPDDEFEQPFNKLDITFVKRFNNTSLTASIENLLGDDVEYKQGDVITNRYEIGTSFSLGISFSFN
jgi:outer membrane receptor for ferrienterochelin and colicin